MGLLVSLVGAECTGKTTLARDLARLLQERDRLRCAWVSESLRLWCDRQGRTPHAQEQAAIAQEQARRIAEAAQGCDVVVADTTPLMTAVYSRILFGDPTLMPQALADQRLFAATLVTANDLPWEADGLQRDGPHLREPVRRLLLDSLAAAGIAHDEVAGLGPKRLELALAHVRNRLQLR